MSGDNCSTREFMWDDVHKYVQSSLFLTCSVVTYTLHSLSPVHGRLSSLIKNYMLRVPFGPLSRAMSQSHLQDDDTATVATSLFEGWCESDSDRSLS